MRAFVIAALLGVAAMAIVPGCAASGVALAPKALSTQAASKAGAPARSPCDFKNSWYFRGACISSNLTARGGHFKLPAYQGVTFDVGIGKNNAHGKVPFVFGDAVGHGDITGKNAGKSFPEYGGKCINADGAPTPCTGTMFVYVELVNPSKSEVFVSGNAQIVVDDANGFPATASCYPAELLPKGWFADQAVGVAPVGNRLTIGIPGGSGFNVPAGALILALVCE